MNKIKFSLVIPVAPERSCEILESIRKLDYPKEKFETIIERGTNPSINRNKGYERSKGEIIVFLDDDAKLNNDYLKKAENFFNKYTTIDLLGGPQLTPKDDKFFAKLTGLAMSSFFGSHKMAIRYKKGKLNLNANEHNLTSANCFVKRNVMEKVKFNPALFPGEDPEFFYNVKKNGYKIAYSPNIVIYHRRRPNLKLFFKQFFKYGKVRVEKESIVGEKINLLFFLPSSFLIYLILLPLLTWINKMFLIPIIIYLFIAIIFSLLYSIKRKNPLILLVLPFIYLIQHISYGSGLIKGLLNKYLKINKR
jgi:cellulose synthase/poly-beta-1,6-N-acetylglucosamine synthase-like glycosyltransferase